MIKANQSFLNVVQVLIDMAVVALSLLLAYWIRFVSPFFTDGIRQMNFLNYFHLAIFIVPVFIVCYIFFGLYKPFRKVRFFKEVIKIITANTFGIMLTVSYLYFTKDINYSRLMLGYFYIGTNTFMILERYTVRHTLYYIRKRGYNMKHILVVGAGLVGQNFVKKIQEEKQLGYNVVGYIDDYYPKKEKNGIKILGTTQELENILNTNYIDEVVIALPNSSHKRINQVIDTCEFAGVKTQVIPDYINLLQGSKNNIYLDELDGIPLINTRYIPLDDPINAGIKRAMDIAGSLLAITITSPIMLLAAIAVKVGSPGPIIYKQERIGKDRKPFTIYKFRSMTTDKVKNKKNGEESWTVKGDKRVTKVGKFLRKYSIDELPQFFNVLKGDMSIIGPRPELPFWVEKYRQKIPNYMIKHHVKPGISGLSQIRGLRGDTPIDLRINADIEYIENWTPWLDLKIAFLTPKAMAGGS